MAADPEIAPYASDNAGGAAHPIVAEAIKRFNRCSEWEAEWRERFIDDLKFAEGDAVNGYQWPYAVKRNRDVDKRPCLTLSIVRQHNLQIMNEQRQNKSSIRIRATGGGATKKSADLFAALIRQTEYRSNAQYAYRMASGYQVKAGKGWIRLCTRYCSPDTFDQEAWILPVDDPLSVFMDPDAKQEDKLDAKFGMVFDLVPEDDWDEAYPEYSGLQSTQPLGVQTGDDDWTIKDHIRVCEYFRKESDHDILLSFIDPTDGLRKSLRKSMMPKEAYKKLSPLPTSKSRSVMVEKIMWYLIAGEQIIDETEWPGKYIPLIPVIGEESVIEGRYDCKGHTRALLDAQRMYNYNASSQVEFVALQSKTPYVAAAKAIEQYESMWNSANQVNHSVLIYNDMDEEYPDRVIAPPARQPPPASAPGFQEGMQTAFNQMMMTSGQWQNQMGMGGNERTGSAIQSRQAQSDTSVFHFQDNYEASLKNCGKQLIDLYPKIFDTKRLMRLVAEDGSEMDVTLDPKQPQALQEETDEHGEIIKRFLNPTLGQYDVEADVGASYGTRRQETVEALTLVLTQAPALTGLIGDLLLRAMDFKESQEAADRLKRMVPPQALGKGPSPVEQQLQQKLQASQMALTKALDRYAKDGLKLVGKSEMRDIDAYKAHTDRIKALAEMLPEDPTVLGELIKELGEDTLGETLRPILQANKQSLETEAGNEGTPPASQSDPSSSLSINPTSNQQWWAMNPQMEGRYLRFAPPLQMHTPGGR